MSAYFITHDKVRADGSVRRASNLGFNSTSDLEHARQILDNWAGMQDARREGDMVVLPVRNEPGAITRMWIQDNEGRRVS